MIIDRWRAEQTLWTTPLTTKFHKQGQFRSTSTTLQDTQHPLATWIELVILHQRATSHYSCQWEHPPHRSVSIILIHIFSVCTYHLIVTINYDIINMIINWHHYILFFHNPLLCDVVHHLIQLETIKNELTNYKYHYSTHIIRHGKCI